MIRLIVEAGALISCTLTGVDGTTREGYAALQRFEWLNGQGGPNRITYDVICSTGKDSSFRSTIEVNELDKRQIERLNRIREVK